MSTKNSTERNYVQVPNVGYVAKHRLKGEPRVIGAIKSLEFRLEDFSFDGEDTLTNFDLTPIKEIFKKLGAEMLTPEKFSAVQGYAEAHRDNPDCAELLKDIKSKYAQEVVLNGDKARIYIGGEDFGEESDDCFRNDPQGWLMPGVREIRKSLP